MEPRPRTPRARSTPTLRFSPYAWAKLLFLRDAGDTEIGGFGITKLDDLLLVEDVCLVQQQCTPISVRFDDEAVADFFDRQVDQGRHPRQFARIWVHTHPCDCAQPSGTDEQTFARCFGRADWAVMFILACGGQTYTRLRFNVGPGGALEIPSEVDFSLPFAAAEQEAWQQEYHANVAGGLLLEDGFDDGFWDCREQFEDAGLNLVERANRELYPTAEDQEQAEWFDWRMRMDS